MKLHLVEIACVFAFVVPNTAIAHDPKGLAAQAAQIAKLSSADQATLQQHERLRDPVVQADLITKALTVTRPANVLRPLDPGETPPNVPPTALQSVLEQVGAANARWQRGETLHVCFLDGTMPAEQQFMQIAAEAVGFTDLKLDPTIVACGSTGAQIHVSFEDQGYYSYVGTDATLFPESTPTLNLEGMGTTATWSRHLQGVARHEIGHMLSMLHEHQHPDIDCGFKSDEEIAKLLGWTVDQVQTNFAQIKESANILKTAYDQTSEMHYQLDPIFFKDGEKSPCFITASNDVYSPGDVAFLKLAYPN